MKFRTHAFVVLFSSIFLISCIKECDPPEVTYPVHGLWIGTYTVNGQPALGERYISYVIKPDGKMIMEGIAESVLHMSTGTWTLSGNTLSCSYTVISGLPSNIGTQQTSTATFDNSGELTVGTWSNVGSSTTGTFKMNRVN